MSGHGYTYTGKGEVYKGVPARDITQEQYDAMAPSTQRRVDDAVKLGSYKPVAAPKSASATKPASDTEGKN